MTVAKMKQLWEVFASRVEKWDRDLPVPYLQVKPLLMGWGKYQMGTITVHPLASRRMVFHEFAHHYRPFAMWHMITSGVDEAFLRALGRDIWDKTAEEKFADKFGGLVNHIDRFDPALPIHAALAPLLRKEEP